MRTPILLTALTVAALTAHAQWSIQDTDTTADLRGIHYVGNNTAWASGTQGTVLRTQNMGAHWQHCTTPPNAEALDFRGIQAFDKDTAIVMSSGKGDLSRLYKTTDGCQTWTLVLTNPDKDGFYDALLFIDHQHGLVLGDPVQSVPLRGSFGDFRLRITPDAGKTWSPAGSPGLPINPGHALQALRGEAAFAASNSSVAYRGSWLWLATSASRVTRRRLYTRAITISTLFSAPVCMGQIDDISGTCGELWTGFEDAQVPIQHGAESAGIFSLHFRTAKNGVAVGGNYALPEDPKQTAALTTDGGQHWLAATTPPHGYRSAVAYDSTHKLWITVGPNGTDISTDDGHNWHPLKPSPAAGDPLDADQHWNALSLPFVAGPHGRIGLLKEHALSPN